MRIPVVTLATALLLIALAPAIAQDEEEPRETVRARVQLKVGGPLEEVDMPIQRVPVDPDSVAAEDSPLDDDDLVLGVVLDGRAMAYPIRYLALHEVIDDQVGDTPLASTW